MHLPARRAAGSRRRAGSALPVADWPVRFQIRKSQRKAFTPRCPIPVQILKKYAKNVAGATQEPAPGFLALQVEHPDDPGGWARQRACECYAHVHVPEAGPCACCLYSASSLGGPEALVPGSLRGT